MNVPSPISRAQDKTVLEAAYNSNPKPDKLARLAIVRRVSLTEKEVQVRLPHQVFGAVQYLRVLLWLDLVPEPTPE